MGSEVHTLYFIACISNGRSKTFRNILIIFSSFVILLLLSPVLIENEEKMTSKKYTPQEIARLILLCWHGEADKQQTARFMKASGPVHIKEQNGKNI